MITIEEQIDFITGEYDTSLDLYEQTDLSSYLTDMSMYSAILKSLKALSSNDLVLQQNCLHCKTSFTTTNSKQQFCTTKCRVAYFRSKNRLKDFTAKAFEILSTKETEPKFAVGVLIVPDGHCSYEVEFKDETYKGKTMREILNKLRKIEVKNCII